MRFNDFEQTARSAWDAIPAAYKAGVDGLIIDRSAHRHPEQPDVYTLGECITEEYPSQFGGPETTRSAVVLYYGSFREIARESDGFDWEAEIHETIMHELQHHLESLATEAGLEDVDYAVDENFKRLNGEPFDPLFFRAGEPIDAAAPAAAFLVEVDVFVELRTRSREPQSFTFEWHGAQYRVALPAAAADVTFVLVEDGPDVAPGDFWVVRVAERGVLATLRSALRGGYTAAETSAVAELVA